MLSFTRLPFLRAFLIASIALVVLCPLVSAQHPIPPAAHPPGSTVHASPPPIFHTPTTPMPIMRAPVVYAPISRPARNAFIPSAGVLGLTGVHSPMRPIRPIHPLPPVVFVYSPFAFSETFWRFNFCWWVTCNQFWPWAFEYTTVTSPGPTNYVTQIYETPVYIYGDEREDIPQLYLKDGTILNVTDYWVVDGQLHFKIIEETGAKAVEESIPFDELDLQQTIDANTRRGFRFVLRNESFEQYLRDHPEGPPPLVPPDK